MFFVNCVCFLKYLFNICCKIFKSKLFITLTCVYLNFFEIFLLFANFVKEVNFRDYFAILFFSSLIDFNNVNLFKDNLKDKKDKNLLSSSKAKTLIA